MNDAEGFAPMVFERHDGSQVLVSLFMESGRVAAIHVAERDHAGDLWGPPLHSPEGDAPAPDPHAIKIFGLDVDELAEAIGYAKRNGWRAPWGTIAAKIGEPQGPSLREVIEFEEGWPINTVRKAQEIHRLFAISMTRYYALLERAVRDDDLAAQMPEVIGRMRDERARRRGERLGGLRDL